MKVKHVFTKVSEASDYIQSLFPSRGSRGHFFSDHVSNRGKEAYEFNIKCCIQTAPWVKDDWDSYYMQLEHELFDFICFLKDTFDWIGECFTAGRSGGWLVITTRDRVFENWEDSDFIMKVPDIIRRANELKAISDYIKQSIHELENMTPEEAEDYWEWCKPDDWDEQVKQKELAREAAIKARQEREQQVVNYVPGDIFYYLETTHRKYILNDRGDIISSYDKMSRGASWSSFGQIPNNNPLIGWNRIIKFTESGIAARKVSFKDFFEGNSDIRGLSFIAYNAPSGSLVCYGESVEYYHKVSRDSLSNYGLKAIV